MLSVLAGVPLAAIVPLTLTGEVNADLVKAAKAGDAATVKELLASHAYEIRKANSTKPALEAAANAGHTETVQVLLDSPVAARDFATMKRAIAAASKKDFIDTVNLLTKGVEPKLLHGPGRKRPAAVAVRRGHECHGQGRADTALF